MLIFPDFYCCFHEIYPLIGSSSPSQCIPHIGPQYLLGFIRPFVKRQVSDFYHPPSIRGDNWVLVGQLRVPLIELQGEATLFVLALKVTEHLGLLAAFTFENSSIRSEGIDSTKMADMLL